MSGQTVKVIEVNMHAAELDLNELLQFDPKGGPIRFAGERALLMDAVALGILRQELIATLGLTGARGVLTRFGYAHGRRSAESLRTAIPWDSVRDWQIAGGRVHTLQGLVEVEAIERDPAAGPVPFAEAIWRDSYEAEQHLLHLGRADDPVCWTLCGWASGYLSFCNGRQIYCLEDRCRGRGDAVCHMIGRSQEEWGPELAPHLAFFETRCMDEALTRVTEQIRDAEKRLQARRVELKRVAGIEEDPSGLVVRSASMRKVLDLARRVAQSDATVLATGESGSGKERIARFVHEESARAAAPFVAVNCGAVPENLLETEMFGHARGAFTGAVSDRPGLFEAAAAGTLFLDEIGELAPSMQVKLLRAIQDREVRRIGENRSRSVDVRIIAATNRPLEADVASGRFRRDLYYRLRVVELRVPPLRERGEDILPLARRFLDEAGRHLKRKVRSLSPAVADQLTRYPWPGNVRELENAMERAVVLARGDRVELEDLPEELRTALAPQRAAGGVRPLGEVERDAVLAALRANDGNQAKTARQLGIGTATLYRKLKSYGGPPAREAR